MPDSPEARLAREGIELPPAGPARGAYSTVAIARGLAFVSAQGPFRDGGIACQGRVGAEVPLDAAREAARLAACNVLAQLRSACGPAGLNAVRRCVQMHVHVASAPGFTGQPGVADAASLVMQAAFAPEPAPARTSLGADRLAGDSTVLIDAIFELH